MQYGLTEEQEMIASTVRSFVEKEIYPHEALVERTGEVPAEIAQEIKKKTLELGLLRLQLPRKRGLRRVKPYGIRPGRARTWPRFHGIQPFLWPATKHIDGLRR